MKAVRVYKTKSDKIMKMYLKIQDVFTRLNEFYQTCQVVRQRFSKTDIWNCSKVPSSCYQINTVLSLQVSQILDIKSEHVRDTGTPSGKTTLPFAILPLSSVGVNSKQNEFAPRGANSFC